jgi:hypothetical protein
MGIDVEHERLIGVSAAARLLPPNRGERPVHPSCILRWITSGVRVGGEIVRLEALRLGGRWVTSVEALQRFGEAQTPRAEGTLPMPRPPASRQRAVEQAQHRLKAVGI